MGRYTSVYLDHTPVAVKVLRPDATHGRSQFQQEVEILSCIRHPNMVLLLGACPEYGCLVYEYMSNGSLEDCLVHVTKPEPLVHRDLKPANILLDRNYVSKISDVGLARLVPPSVADNVTQYRMTSTAGTFCYIDPEYQQTGKPPMGLTHHVERAIERGGFREMLDPSVPDWPLEEALEFAKLALKCSELRRKDRPDLGRYELSAIYTIKHWGLTEGSKYRLTENIVLAVHRKTGATIFTVNSKLNAAPLPSQVL
ncbi:UNVERIFIED_CONTAM: U-box domain-containing protein 34 [Sesamum radiatum]|uniref:RING-type E3 ubiquitin transferase n=1 Tax=Sesamum radiatum TaxID=300843 RepID=A0AAW2L0U2_SESRA